jgi:hypothetical protein
VGLLRDLAADHALTKADLMLTLSDHQGATDRGFRGRA